MSNKTGTLKNKAGDILLPKTYTSQVFDDDETSLDTLLAEKADSDSVYVKPASGIPKTDLTSAVQTSLDKADTALQSHQDISGKQDTIADLSTIRSNAALAASAYQKPASGIPKSDLASAVQTSLGKADTALQSSDISSKADKSSTVSTISYDSTSKVLTKTINGTTTNVASAATIVTDGGALTSHQDISAKEDKANKTTSLNSTSTNDQYPTAKAVYDALQNVDVDAVTPQMRISAAGIWEVSYDEGSTWESLGVSALGESPDKGLFDTVSSLRSAYPSPSVGWNALVGTSSPLAVYKCTTAGTWTDSGMTASVSGIDFSNLVYFGD